MSGDDIGQLMYQAYQNGRKSMEAERDAAIARAEKAEQERDAAEKEALRADDAGRAATGALMDQIARAEAAEAQVAKLREALANVDKLRHAVCLVGAHPIDGPRLLAGESGYMRLDLVQQVWLAARAALAGPRT